MSTFSSLNLMCLLAVAFGDHPDTNDDVAGYDEGDHHMHAMGYARVFSNTTVNGQPFQQISGLCNNDNSTHLTYYGISQI